MTKPEGFYYSSNSAPVQEAKNNLPINLQLATPQLNQHFPNYNLKLQEKVISIIKSTESNQILKNSKCPGVEIVLS